MINKLKSLVSSCIEKTKTAAKVVAALAVTAVAGSVFAPSANAAIDLSDFTDALGDVSTAINTALPSFVTQALGVAGVLMGGMLLWRFFRRMIGA